MLEILARAFAPPDVLATDAIQVLTTKVPPQLSIKIWGVAGAIPQPTAEETAGFKVTDCDLRLTEVGRKTEQIKVGDPSSGTDSNGDPNVYVTVERTTQISFAHDPKGKATATAFAPTARFIHNQLDLAAPAWVPPHEASNYWLQFGKKFGPSPDTTKCHHVHKITAPPNPPNVTAVPNSAKTYGTPGSMDAPTQQTVYYDAPGQPGTGSVDPSQQSGQTYDSGAIAVDPGPPGTTF